MPGPAALPRPWCWVPRLLQRHGVQWSRASCIFGKLLGGSIVHGCLFAVQSTCRRMWRPPCSLPWSSRRLPMVRAHPRVVLPLPRSADLKRRNSGSIQNNSAHVLVLPPTTAVGAFVAGCWRDTAAKADILLRVPCLVCTHAAWRWPHLRSCRAGGGGCHHQVCRRAGARPRAGPCKWGAACTWYLELPT